MASYWVKSKKNTFMIHTLFSLKNVASITEILKYIKLIKKIYDHDEKVILSEIMTKWSTKLVEAPRASQGVINIPCS